MAEVMGCYEITVKVNQSQTEVRMVKANFILELLQWRKSGLIIELGMILNPRRTSGDLWPWSGMVISGWKMTKRKHEE